MNTYHGTVSLESNYKEDLHYTTIQATSLEEAQKKTQEKFAKRFIKPRKILGINLTILKEGL